MRLTALCFTKSPECKEGHHLPKILYLLPFIVNSQEQIITTTNKNNLQGHQTLDINKDTINIKESLCWMWLPPFLGVYMLVATAKPLSWGEAEASVKYLWNLYHKAGHSDPEHKLPLSSQPNRTSAISKWSRVLAPGVFAFVPLLGSVSWAGHELEWVAICSVRRGVCVPSPLLILPAPISSASILPAAGYASPTYCHFKNSRMHPKWTFLVHAF